MKRHYSVRRSKQFLSKWKIVIAGKTGCFSHNYEDIDTPLFDSFEEALVAAERLNKLVPLDG